MAGRQLVVGSLFGGAACAPPVLVCLKVETWFHLSFHQRRLAQSARWHNSGSITYVGLGDMRS